jgi:hypothetical protein
MTDTDYLGRVLVTGEHESISTDEVIKEFEIELPDDYMARALTHRHTPGNME